MKTRDGILRRACIRAPEHGMTINGLVCDYAGKDAARSTAAEGVTEFLDATRGAGATSGSEGRTRTRDDIYDE